MNLKQICTFLDILIYNPPHNLIQYFPLVVAMDPLKAVSVSKAVSVFIEEPNYPDLLYCEKVVRPDVVYACSVIMFGNVGNVTVEFSNANITTTQIPGIIVLFLIFTSKKLALRAKF